MHTPPHMQIAIFPPDEHALCKENFLIVLGMHSHSAVAAFLLVLTKKSAAPGHRMPEEIFGTAQSHCCHRTE